MFNKNKLVESQKLMLKNLKKYVIFNTNSS